MPPQIALNDTTLSLDFSGIERLLAVASRVEVPVAAITGVRFVAWDEVRAELGWRTAGGYVPGWLATGWFAVPQRAGFRQFLWVWRDRDELLQIDTNLQRPARLVLAHHDQHGIAAQLEARLHP